MKRTRSVPFALVAILTAAGLAAAEGSAGGIRWTTPAHWKVAGPRPMRMATYTIPGVQGAEEGECGVFYFGKGQGGSVDENLSRWVRQFDSAKPPKNSERTIHGLRVHLTEVSGTYLAPGGPMMQSQGKKEGWSLAGAIVEAPEGLVFFKCVGPAATIQAARKDFDALLESLAKVAGGART
jgi:hypothetical protein